MTQMVADEQVRCVRQDEDQCLAIATQSIAAAGVVVQ